MDKPWVAFTHNIRHTHRSRNSVTCSSHVQDCLSSGIFPGCTAHVKSRRDPFSLAPLESTSARPFPRNWEETTALFRVGVGAIACVFTAFRSWYGRCAAGRKDGAYPKFAVFIARGAKSARLSCLVVHVEHSRRDGPTKVLKLLSVLNERFKTAISEVLDDYASSTAV